MSKKTENTEFQCEKCFAYVKPVSNGSFRNHCPYCLYSKHMDNNPGDRKSDCKGLMKPVGLDYTGKKGFQIVHECLLCNKVQRNKIAVNSVQEDDILKFMKTLN